MPRWFVAVNAPFVEVAGGKNRAASAPLHFTLRFLGDTPAEDSPRVLAAMQRAANGVDAFSIELRGVGAFPSVSRPRVIWVGVRDGADGLVHLAGRVSDELAIAGWAPEPRPFSPHLTVLRVSHPGKVAEARRLLDLGPDRPFGTVRVEEIVLKESQLTSEGAIHTVVGRAPLVGPVSRRELPSAPSPSVSTGTE